MVPLADGIKATIVPMMNQNNLKIHCEAGLLNPETTTKVATNVAVHQSSLVNVPPSLSNELKGLKDSADRNVILAHQFGTGVLF
jgi:hypothetical protein